MSGRDEALVLLMSNKSEEATWLRHLKRKMMGLPCILTAKRRRLLPEEKGHNLPGRSQKFSIIFSMRQSSEYVLDGMRHILRILPHRLKREILFHNYSFLFKGTAVGKCQEIMRFVEINFGVLHRKLFPKT